MVQAQLTWRRDYDWCILYLIEPGCYFWHVYVEQKWLEESPLLLIGEDACKYGALVHDWHK